MRVVIAIDSFKGSLSSLEAASAVREGLLRAAPDTDVVIRPLADGGEGTTEALITGMHGTPVDIKVTGPDGCPVIARYGILPDGVTAVMEMASAAGLALLDRTKLDPRHATTFGVGQMITDALDRGCRRFIVGIGGSATIDVGLGMLSALGVRFLDADGLAVTDAEAIGRITSIDLSHRDRRLEEASFRIACDVTNPLCGEKGTIAVFGKQKGVKDEEVALLDGNLKRFSAVAAETIGTDHSSDPGAGAAGGLGFAFLSFFPLVSLESGVGIVLEAIRLDEVLDGADLVITGEGRLDAQTVMGKAPIGVARAAKKKGIPVIAFAGGVTDDATLCNEYGIDAFFPAVRGVTTLDEAMKTENAARNLTLTAEQAFRLLLVGMKA